MSLYGEMRRSFEAEILDSGGQQPEILARAHRALSLTHSVLGNHAAILRALRRDGEAVRRVLDIGCGHGGLLEKVRRQIGAEVLGVDLRPPERCVGKFPILQLDAVRAVAPLCLPRVNVLDGRQSIRRAYTPEEFRSSVARAVAGTGAKFRHTVAPLWIRQMADIRY